MTAPRTTCALATSAHRQRRPLIEHYGLLVCQPCIDRLSREPTLCTCGPKADPDHIDQCRLCYRPVHEALARRYGWDQAEDVA